MFLIIFLDLDLLKHFTFQSISSMKEDSGKKVEVLDLWRTPLMRLISCVQYVVWFSVYLVYYGLVLNLSNIGGDVYVNTVISGNQHK